MASQIIITAEATGDVLDLFQGVETEFYITRQIHDLHNFETRNADYSKSLEIPPTTTNLRILNTEQNDPEQQGVQCSIQMAGVMIAPKALMYYVATTIDNDRSRLQVQILTGNFNFFNAIAAGDLSTINWADLAIVYDPIPLRAASLNTTDLVFPYADWAARGAVPMASPTLFDVNHAGFFMFCKEIITRIVAEAGFTVIFANNLPADFFTIALACPVTKFLAVSSTDQLSISQFVENTITQQVTNVSERILFQDDTDATIWNAANQEWQPNVAGNLTFEITGTYSQIVQGNRPDSQIRIVRNTSTIATFFINGNQPAGTEFYLGTTITALNGDVVFAEIESFATQAVAQIELGSRFKVSTVGGDVDRTVQPSDWIPKMDRKPFLTSILNVFNLVLNTDDIAKTVTVNNFNDVFTGEEQDLTTKLDVGGVVEIVPGIDSIGRDSLFTWENDDLLRSDFNLTLRFENDILAPEKTVISLPYSAADPSFNFVTAASVFLKSKNPMYSTDLEIFNPPPTFASLSTISGTFLLNSDVDFQIGDWFFILNNQYRVVAKSGDRSGQLQEPLIAGTVGDELLAVKKYTPQDQTPRLAIIHIDGSESEISLTQGRDVSESVGQPTSQTATWFDRMKWEEQATLYYADIMNAMQTPQVIKGYFNLSIFDFVQLDHLRPIYIQQYNAFFYLNLIEQFKLDNKTRLELIRISTLTTQAVLGAFDNGFDNGFNQ